MFIPIGTDRPPRRRPIVNETLITINLLVYLIGVAGTTLGWFDRAAIASIGHFDPNEFKPWQLITYQFIHDPYGLGHIFFNMLGLWVFGNSVEGRFGRIGYLFFYLTAGIIAGLGHGLLAPSIGGTDIQPSIIGASGSIAGVTGAFLALFPRSHIRVIFLLTLISIPALWVIGLYIGLDLIRQVWDAFGGGGSNVAYAAHLAGYFFGFTLSFALLGMRIIRREEFDVFFLFKQARRRRQFRAATRTTQKAVWDRPSTESSDQYVKRARQGGGEMTQQEEELADRRAEVSRLATELRMDDALRRYLDLEGDFPGVVMHERLQADIANELYKRGKATDAANAYEKLLASYPGTDNATQYKLLLGLIYTRQLHEPERAQPLVESARHSLTAGSEADLADDLLREISAALPETDHAPRQRSRER